MLVLSRKKDEEILIDGRISVKVVRVRGNTVQIGIEAPREIPIHRQELAPKADAKTADSPTRREKSLAG
ncbi:MAG: carbon storage regulator [Planctomycetes bacterium]|nr:carbon storage regulator [Planctomycetota bacterium]